MKIGFKEISINPEFPVYRMLKGKGGEKIMEVSDDLHCRMLVIDPATAGSKPWYHISIDSVEIWEDVRNQIKKAVEEAIGRETDMVVSATHCHNCPCMTTDYDWDNWLINKIRENVGSIELKEYEKVEYSYNYRYFNKVGDSREANGKHKVVHLYAETLSLYGDGNRVGTILMHNCHPTIKRLANDPFTSEYPGYCIKKLTEEHEGEFFTFMLGPAGDVSPHFVRENRDYPEIARLGDLLCEEYDRQLASQKELKPVDKFCYREKVLPLEVGDSRSQGQLIIPNKDRITEQELQTLDMIYHPKFNRPARELEPMEKVETIIISQLILNEDYSIIFEPFELYSEYYGAVNKQTTSLISISNGFQHYLTGLYLNHLVQHGNGFSGTNFGNQMKRDLWELFGKWSCQQDSDTF